MFTHVWGYKPQQLSYRIDSPAHRGFLKAEAPPIRNSSDAAQVAEERGDSGSPRSLVIRPALGRDHWLIDSARRADRRWLAQWEATLPPEAQEQVPDIFRYQRRVDKEQRNGSALIFGIWADGHAIGQVSVSNVVRGAMSQGMLGYWVVGSWAGRGVGSLSVAVVIDAVIGELGLHRIEACVRPENERSLALCRKLGMYEEGLRPRFMHIAGSWADHIAFSIDAESYPEGGLVKNIWGRSIDE